MSSSYRFNRLGLSHRDPYAVHRGGCLQLYYCKMVEWLWFDSSLISTTNWFPSVLWHCWFGHLACKNHPQNDLLCVDWDVKPYTHTHSLTHARRSCRIAPIHFLGRCHKMHLNQAFVSLSLVLFVYISSYFVCCLVFV